MVVKFSGNLSRIVLFIYNFPYGAHLYRLEQRELGTPFHKMNITIDDSDKQNPSATQGISYGITGNSFSSTF